MTRLFAVVVVATCAVISCSGRAPALTKPTNPPPAGSGSGSAIGPAETRTKVSEADCLAAIDHMIDVDIKERPADQQLSADQAAELRTTLRGSFLATCMEQPREIVACITAAGDRAAIKACNP